jgi:hypothetical protein
LSIFFAERTLSKDVAFWKITCYKIRTFTAEIEKWKRKGSRKVYAGFAHRAAELRLPWRENDSIG